MIVLKAAVAALIALTAAAQAADCPREGALGTSRVLAVDPATPRVAASSQTLPRRIKGSGADLDDGPYRADADPGALAHNASATFFRSEKATAEPDMVRKIAAEGHTAGHHTAAGTRT